MVERAQSFDGYGYVGGSTAQAEALALSVRSSWAIGEADLLPLDDIRGALFAECRMIHHSGDYLTDQRRRYLFALDQLVSGNGAAGSPWAHVRPDEDGSYVVPDDAPYLEAFKRTLAPESKDHLDLRLLPEPWCGRLDAPIVILGLNPGTDADTLAAHQHPEVRRGVHANLAGHPAAWPLFWLDPELETTPGAKWWRKCLKGWLQEVDASVVARNMVAYEFFGYHSRSAGNIPITLPSQRWLFGQLRSHLRAAPIVIALWGANRWKVAVPELLDYKHFHLTKNVQAGTVNPTNLSPDAAAAVRGVLTGAS